jgi:hypothetical protein
MARTPADDPAPVDAALPLDERMRVLLIRFDGETHDYAFCDSGDGVRYATWFADLLDEALEEFADLATARRLHVEPGDWRGQYAELAPETLARTTELLPGE